MDSNNNIDTVTKCILNLLRNEKHCDVVFIVGEGKERIPCHQLLLIARSPVFEVMFAERWRSGNAMEEIYVPDVEPSIFRIFLQFIYGDNFTKKTHEAIQVLYVANKYQVDALVKECELLMESQFQLGDAIQIYQAARQFNFSSLEQQAADMMTNEFSKLIDDPSFKLISEETLLYLLAKDDLIVSELKLFRALLNWAHIQLGTETPDASDLRKVLQKLLPLVRFPLMEVEDFALEVVPKHILSPMEAVTLFTYFNCPKPSQKDSVEARILSVMLGFPCNPRNLVVTEKDYCVEFYKSKYLSNAYRPKASEFTAIDDHIDAIHFSVSYEKPAGSTAKLVTARLTSLILRGPDYSAIRNDIKASWISEIRDWNVAVKLEKYSVSQDSNEDETCSSITKMKVELLRDKDTELLFDKPFSLEPGYSYRISVLYGNKVYLPIVGRELFDDRISSTRFQPKCTYQNGGGALTFDVQICEDNLHDIFFRGRGDKPFYSHCIRSIKMCVSTSRI